MNQSVFSPEIMAQIVKSITVCAGYLSVGLAAVGSCFGTCAAGCAAVGAWKRCYMNNKPAPFLLSVLAGAPLSQTIYAFVLMVLMKDKVTDGNPMVLLHLTLGLLSGVVFLFSAWFQGKAAAAACDAFGETGKGFSNYMIVVGIIETVALFALGFAIMVL